jgi:hypothetical protein
MHRAMADDPAMASVDLVHLAGPRMRALYDALPPKRRGHLRKRPPMAARGWRIWSPSAISCL